MKGIVIVPIILGSLCLVAGGVVLGVGIATSKNNSKAVHKDYEFDASEEFNKLNINLSIANLEFVSSASAEQVSVSVDETEKLYHEVTLKDGCLNIEFKDASKWYEKVFNFTAFKEKVKVTLPEKVYDSAKIKVSTGDIKIDSGLSFTSLDIKSSTGNVTVSANVTTTTYVEASTGNVKFNDMTTNKMNIKTSTGDITLDNVVVEDGLTTKASTGKVTLKEVTAKNLTSNTSTGDHMLIDTVIADKLFIKCSTGDVKFDDSDADTMEVKTSTGYIKGTLLSEHYIIAQSDTGKVQVPESRNGGTCRFTTDTGDIIISFKA